MKKIILTACVITLFSSIQAFSACPLNFDTNSSKSCTVGLQSQNQTIKDKLIPNNLNQMTNPERNSSREFQKQPHAKPDTVNREQYNDPEQSNGNTPYNAACQFGVCLPGDTGNNQTGR